MKNSGVDWLGQVPEHWAILPNRALFTEVNERDHPDEQMLSVTIVRGVVRQRDLLADSSKKDGSNLDKAAYKLATAGDLAYNKMRAWQGAIGVSDYRGIVSPAYVVERPREGALSHYFHYLLRTPAFAKEAERWSYGITSDMWSLRPEHFRLIQACLPTPTEQQSIVRFLGYSRQQIARHIRAKLRLIQLLEEQRRAIIHRAVRGGLDSRVPLKASGVAWLGDVPEHWDLSRVKNEFVCLNHRRVPLSAIQRGTMTSKRYDYYGASSVIDRVDGFTFEDDLLLIAEDGANLVLRNLPLAIIARGRFWVNNHAHILKPRRGNLRFLAHLMETISYLPWISGAAQPKLTKDRLLSIAVAVPPVAEQERIVEWLDATTRPWEIGISRARRQIALLKEYQTRLVADVVTGKLDVRDAAAALPEDIPGTIEPDEEGERSVAGLGEEEEAEAEVMGVDV
jgi:type I restriction enzyme S subunit